MYNWKHVFTVALLIRCVIVGYFALHRMFYDDFDESSSNLATWDSVFFLDIAEYGYSFDNFVAFFPLWPNVLAVVPISMRYHMGVILSNLLFCATTSVFYEWATLVLPSPRAALLAVIYLAINPASIFFSVPYTEAPFFFLSAVNVYLITTPPSTGSTRNPGSSPTYMDTSHCVRIIIAAICGAAASSCRSNGALLGGFAIARFVVDAAQMLQVGRSTPSLHRADSAVRRPTIAVLLCLVVAAVAPLIPSVIVQRDVEAIFCRTAGGVGPDMTTILALHDAADASVIPPGAAAVHSAGSVAAEWCGRESAYSYVQRVYWGVGFLKYWTVNNTGFILIAVPCFAFVVLAVLSVPWAAAWRCAGSPCAGRAPRAADGAQSALVRALRAVRALVEPLPAMTWAASPSTSRDGCSARAAGSDHASIWSELAATCVAVCARPAIVAVVEVFVRVVVCVVYVHVPVTVRFLATAMGTPFLAALIMWPSVCGDDRGSCAARAVSRAPLFFLITPWLSTALIVLWCFAYIIIGGALHPGFFPWV